LKEHIVLKVVSRFITPFILLYALYVQLHGEYSPGGGFQAGVIFASAFILFCLINGLSKTLRLISIEELKMVASIGALMFIGAGFYTMFAGAEFLNYSVIAEDQHTAQQIGIVFVELGVGLTVFAAAMLIFLLFAKRKKIGKND
jgi:multicomponent Na+:H+ antiporter subunit B